MWSSILLLLLTYITTFPLLLIYQQPLDYTILWYAGVTLTTTLIAYFIISKFKIGCRYIFITAAMLSTIGFIVLARLNVDLFYKQSIWYVLGVIFYFVTYLVFGAFKNRHKLVWIYYLASICLFGITLVFGQTIGGAKNWLIIGKMSFQLSEIVKILFVLFLASYFTIQEEVKQKSILNFYDYLFTNGLVLMILVYSMIGCLVLQKDWGSAVLLFITYLAFVYIYQQRNKWFILITNIALMSAGLFLGYKYLPHIQVRIESFLNPWADVHGKGYQIVQSLFAIAAGGFFGKGIGLGFPQYIPEVRTDFIFAAICEELGIFIGISIILLFYIIGYRGIKFALKTNSFFQKSLSTGLTIMIFIQTFIIIGGVIKMIPLTGITLPFISYGGSSIISGFMMLSLLAFEDRKRKNH